MNRRRFAATMLQGLASVRLIGVIGRPAQKVSALPIAREQEDPIMYKLPEEENTGYNMLVGYNIGKPGPSRRGRRFADYNYQRKNFNQSRR